MNEDITIMLLERVKMYKNLGYTTDQALLFGLMEEITHITFKLSQIDETLREGVAKCDTDKNTSLEERKDRGGSQIDA